MRFWVIILIVMMFPINLVLALESNAGIVNGLWYDQDNFLEGETIRIYVAVRNNTGADLKGTVDFFVNGERIERNFITALNGRIIESWADWIPTFGTSTLSATLSRTELSTTASGTKTVTVTSSIAKDIIFVDHDTDRDGVGNLLDTDDDGDGVSDSLEEMRGTDPLKYDGLESEENNSNKETNENSKDDKSQKPSSDPVEPQGLEQFLTKNRAGDTLSSITNFINTSKNKLDEYRQERRMTRAENKDELRDGGEAAVSQSTTTSPTEKNYEKKEVSKIDTTNNITNHIGEITRNSSKTNKENYVVFIGNIFNILKNSITFIFDTFLFGLSKLLAHPILVQIVLLILILFLFLKLAKRIANRKFY